LEFANASSDMAYINELTTKDIRDGKLVPIGVTNPVQRPTILVWGDSHAMAALPAMDAFLKEKGLTGCAATHSATAPVLGWFFDLTEFGLKEKSLAYNDSVFAYIRQRKIPNVVLSAHWSFYASDESKAKSKAFQLALLTTVRRLTATGTRLYILMDVPIHTFDIPRALARSCVSNTSIESLCAKPTDKDKFDNIDPRIMAQILKTGARIINPKPRFLAAGGRYYFVQLNGTALYRDDHHLTTKGAKIMLLPLFRDSLRLKK
jgi:hypothetical protein